MSKELFKKIMKWVMWIPLWCYIVLFWYGAIKGLVDGLSTASSQL